MLEISALSLIPPFLIVITAFFTQRILLSFSVGIIVGSFLAAKGKIAYTMAIMGKYLWSSSGLEVVVTHDLHHNGNAAIFLFLVVLGIIIMIVKKSGGADAYRSYLRKRIQNARSAETTSLLVSLFFFIDDYFSALTVGLLMQPLTDSFKISRVKLAFLVDTMAAPLAVISPISSWVGEIVAQLQVSGIRNDGSHLTLIHGEPFNVFLHVIPTIFYSLILITTVFFIVRRRISFGLMKKFEQEVSYKDHNELVAKGKSIDFIAPMLFLIGSIFIGFLYSGNWWFFGGNASLHYAVTHPHVYTALALGALSALVLTIVYFLYTKTLSKKELVQASKEGFFLMFPALLMLLLAWTSGKIITYELHTGNYIAYLLGSLIPLPLFAAFCFCLSLLVAMTIGSAWATIGVIFPVVIPMIPVLFQTSPPIELLPAMFPIIGAVLSGALAGMQVSFFSDTPLLASTSTRAVHIHHIQTQIRYLIPIIIATFIAYLLCGILMYHGYSLRNAVLSSYVVGIICAWSYLEIRHRT